MINSITEPIKVDSRQEWVATDVWVKEGDQIHFRARGLWVDFFVPCSADGWSAGFLYRAGKLPRVDDNQRYFRLMGCISADGTEPSMDAPTAGFAIGSQAIVKANEAGRLYLFVSDRAGFYWNSWGSLKVSVGVESPGNLTHRPEIDQRGLSDRRH